MDRAAVSHQEKELTLLHNSQQYNFCLPLVKPRPPYSPNPLSVFTFWVSKSVRSFLHKAKISNGLCGRRLQFSGMVVNNSAYCASPCFLDSKMEGLGYKSGVMQGEKCGFGENVGHKVKAFGNVTMESRESSSSSDFLGSEATVNEEHSSTEDMSSSPSMGWPNQKTPLPHCASPDVSVEVDNPHFGARKFEKQGSSPSEIEMMKERFSKLLLGEDMSGCGNGVCTALAISNAITNLCATLFGQIWRLEPLPPEKKTMWRREMEWLLCVSDHIVELTPSWQTFPDGSKLEVMTSRPRTDLYINLPALRKLDNMLLEILDSFDNTEFWYVDQGILAPEADGSSSFRIALPRQEEKWWLPVPRVPAGGLSENARKQLHHKRDCTNQILKAAMAINSITLADMEVPESYLEALPKNGRASLGDLIHRYITSDQFSPECLLDCIDLSSEHHALEVANRVEASTYVWRRRTNSKSLNSTNRSNSKSSWEMVKELVIDADKRELLAERAESLLLCLKQRFPGLPQTTLDMSKIQYNKDVGKSILESYSRVLESLAFNIVARIDDLLHVDDLAKHSDHFLSMPKVGMIAQRTVGIPCSLPVSSTPYKTAFTTPSFSTSQRISPAKLERTPFTDSSKIPHRGLGVKKVLTDYLSIETKGKEYSSPTERSDSFSSTTREASSSQRFEPFECSKESISSIIHDSVTKE